MQVSRSRKLSAVALFAALAVVLNFVVSVPAPFAPFLNYEIWEVPIMAAFLIFGAWVGVAVAALNLVVLEVVNPGALPTGPVYNFFAILATMLGVFIAQKALLRTRRGMRATTITATALGATSRTAIMTVVNWVVLPMPYPIGFGSFGITAAAVPPLLPLIAVFNATVALYTIPLAYAILKVVASRSRIAVARRGVGRAETEAQAPA